jgi:hypothetical protein
MQQQKIERLVRDFQSLKQEDQDYILDVASRRAAKQRQAPILTLVPRSLPSFTDGQLLSALGGV